MGIAAKIEAKMELDWRTVEEVLSSSTKRYLERSGLRGVVVGLSGGLDSSVVAHMLAGALGDDKVLALLLRSAASTPKEDVEDARTIAKMAGLRLIEMEIDPIYAGFAAANPIFMEESMVANGNLRARIRMALLYYAANRHKLLVAGTSDKSEICIGYFTKHGDGAADLLPIGDLYKTQVRMFARHLGLPPQIAEKPSSPRLWPGHDAEKELGVDYCTVDLVLYSTQVEGLGPIQIARNYGLDSSKIARVLQMVRSSRHKRRLAPILKIQRNLMRSART